MTEAVCTSPSADAIHSLADLRTFVHETLCRRENLMADQFAMSETPLVRCGVPCGLQFAVQGPRRVRLGAVWASEQNVLYCYDARGERFLKLPLPRRVA